LGEEHENRGLYPILAAQSASLLAGYAGLFLVLQALRLLVRFHVVEDAAIVEIDVPGVVSIARIGRTGPKPNAWCSGEGSGINGRVTSAAICQARQFLDVGQAPAALALGIGQRGIARALSGTAGRRCPD